jgi:hypothetical protein
MTFELKGREITYFNKLHICSKIVNNVSVPLLSHTFHEHCQLQPLRTYLFRCSLVRFTIKNTIYSVISRLVCSVFPHLLFRYFTVAEIHFDLPKHCVFTSWPCPSARKSSEIKGQITSAALIARAWATGKKCLFLKIKNKHFYSPYSNEILDIKALEYKEYFTHIDLWRILKNSQDI